MMMSVPRWMLLVCCLVVVVPYSSLESLQRYLANRQAVVLKESSQRTGGSLQLNSKELRVNDYLMTAKSKEYTAAIQGAPFPPAQHFFKSKNLIDKSEVFQLIQLLPKGRHCCLYCNITKANMMVPLNARPALQQRSLETLTSDFQRFRACGAHHTLAKEVNNVIDEPIFAIPLTQVCPPGLHISLGLYLKHFNSFEGACHDLDMEAAAVLAEKDREDWDSLVQTCSSRYQTLISVLKKARCLEEQAKVLDEELNLREEQLTDAILTAGEDSTDIQEYISATTELVNRQKKLLEEASALREKAALRPGQGPLAGQLDITLQEFRVKRQAYDGKSFVGNHVHKCCKEENIKLLTDALINKTQQVCPSLVAAATSIAAKYAKLFHLFGTCHRMYNSASLLDDSAIDALDQAIKDYMNYFRMEFALESIPPKIHLLEDHVVPWIRRWRFGLGFHGEQGGESVHSLYNNIRHDVRGIRSDVDILKSVVKPQWIMTSPAHAPPSPCK